jgi:hypothetical protein
VHKFIQLCTLRVLISIFLEFVASVVLVVESAKANPAKLVVTLLARHVLAPSVLVNQRTALWTLLGKFRQELCVLSLALCLLGPVLNHLAIRWCVREATTAKAKQTMQNC